MAEKIRVFLSYSRRDQPFALRLREVLIGDGFDAHLDTEDIVHGEPWKARLAGLIAATDAVLFLLSPDAVASDICAWEVDEAERLAKRIFPVVCRPTPDASVPGRLQRLNYAFLETDARWSTQYPALVRALRTDTAWVREHTRLGDEAARWARDAKATRYLLRTDAIAAADEWAARRPAAAPPLSALMLDFLDASRVQERFERDGRRRLAQRGFVLPARAAIAQGRHDAALRLLATGALASDDLALALDAQADEAARFALWRAAAEAVLQAPLAVLHGHDDTLVRVAVSPDGRAVLSAARDGGVRLWNPVTGATAVVLQRHGGEVHEACFSADGRRVLTASADGSARVWDALGGAAVAAFHGHAGAVLCAAFSADGRRVVSGGADKTARIWSTDTAAALQVLEGHAGDVAAVAFSPDGSRVATGSDDGSACLWDAGSGALVARLPGRGYWVHHLRFTADGTRLVTGAQGTHNVDEDSIRVWDAGSGRELAAMRGFTDWIEGLAVSPDGAFIASASRGDCGQLWYARSGEKVADLGAPDTTGQQAVCVAFSVDGTQLVTGGIDGAVRLWAGRSGAPLATFHGHEAPVVDVAFSPCGRWFVSAGGGEVVSGATDPTARVWRTEAPRPRHALPAHRNNTVWSVALAPDGLRGVSGSSDPPLKLWNPATGEPVATLAVADGETLRVAFSADGSLLASTSGTSAEARIWDGRSGAPLAMLRAHDGDVVELAFSPDGRAVLTAGKDGQACLWDAASGALRQRFAGHDGTVSAVAFAPGGHFVASGGEDGTARLWNAADGACIAVLRGHGQGVESVAFHPGGGSVLTGSSDGSARLWSVPGGEPLAVLASDRVDTARVVFSADGRRVLSGGSEHVVAGLWEAAPSAPTGWRLTAALADHRNFMGGLVHGAFSPDGTRVYTGSYCSDKVLVSDAATGATLARLEGGSGKVFQLALDGEGRTLACATSEGTVDLWDLVRVNAFAGDRAVYLAAALDAGVGRRTAAERASLLMQDAPDDLFAEMVSRLTPAQQVQVDAMSRRLRER